MYVKISQNDAATERELISMFPEIRFNDPDAVDRPVILGKVTEDVRIPREGEFFLFEDDDTYAYMLTHPISKKMRMVEPTKVIRRVTIEEVE